MFFNILIVLFAISCVVFLHELGHFIVAKCFGVNIEKFSIGFGKELFGFTKSGTRYSLAVFPLGGYVKMQGENIFDEIEESSIGDFTNLHYFKRIVVVGAGAIVNIILAIFVVLFITFFSGVYVADTSNLVIGSVLSGSKAELAGIEQGDVLKSINGMQIDTWIDVFNFSDDYNGSIAKVLVLREGKELIFDIIPNYDKNSSRYILGISPSGNKQKVSFIQSFDFTFKYFDNLTQGFFKTILALFSKNEQKGELLGPIGVVRELTSAINQGFLRFLFLLAIVSFNLGLVNLLPLPILDGGHIVIYFFEWITGRKINQKILEFLFSIMFIFLVIFMIFVTNKDILRIFKG